MNSGTIYSIGLTDKLNELTIQQEQAIDFVDNYTTTAVVKVEKKEYLLAYDSTTGKTTSYELSDTAPFLKEVTNELNFGKGWQKLEPFYMANAPYVLCYEPKEGKMYFFPVEKNLVTKPPLHFYHHRSPFTTNLTEVKTLVSQGQVFVLGYNGENGYVNIWTVSATSVSDGKKPPLAVNIAWAHQWAKGWTRFAFFTWGNENFFLKTNTWKPNVNIDHIWNDLSKGTNEVGSHLKLKDDQELSIVRPFEIDNGAPYFVTYLPTTGESNFNRVHGNCFGWSTCATITEKTTISDIVLFKVNDKNFILYL